MNCAPEMNSSAMIHIPISIKSGSGIQKLIRCNTHTETYRKKGSHMPTLTYQNNICSLKILMSSNTLTIHSKSVRGPSGGRARYFAHPCHIPSNSRMYSDYLTRKSAGRIWHGLFWAVRSICLEGQEDLYKPQS